MTRYAPRLLQDDPREWRRRGLRSPAEIAALVQRRLIPHEPCYGDFFVAPTEHRIRHQGNDLSTADPW